MYKRSQDFNSNNGFAVPTLETSDMNQHLKVKKPQTKEEHL